MVKQKQCQIYQQKFTFRLANRLKLFLQVDVAKMARGKDNTEEKKENKNEEKIEDVQKDDKKKKKEKQSNKGGEQQNKGGEQPNKKGGEQKKETVIQASVITEIESSKKEAPETQKADSDKKE